MAEKHKSKYKKPENTKYKSRKDLKDYTMDDKDEKLNPKSTGEKQSNVLRKTDKEMIDDGNLVPTYDANDRLYKDLEDGEYDEKHAAKVLKKRQDDEESDVEKTIEDKIKVLTREQKEQMVRQYIRRKIERVLSEQVDTKDTEEAPVPNEEVPAPEAPAPEAPAAPAAPAPEAPAPAPETPAEIDPAEQAMLAIDKFVNHLKSETGNISRIKTLAKVLNLSMKDADPDDYKNFYQMLRSLAINKLSAGAPQETQK